ncbi:MAG: TrkA family potassium uptake protein [Arcanobacterium sp.]|nr:TrkA family potassium uptake protein [Arcanobacterium sp.]
MKVLIAGAGSVGCSIARDLVGRGNAITLIDSDPKAMRVSRVPEADWILADACELSTLQSLDLSETEVVVATTGDDKANLVLALLAKTEFGVPRVVARVNNPANEWLFTDAWGVDFAVSTPRLITMIVDEVLSPGELTKRIEFENSQSSLYQCVVATNALIVNKKISEAILPQSFFISAVIRDGVGLQADPALRILENDRLLFIGYDPTPEDIRELTVLTSAQ